MYGTTGGSTTHRGHIALRVYNIIMYSECRGGCHATFGMFGEAGANYYATVAYMPLYIFNYQESVYPARRTMYFFNYLELFKFAIHT